MMEWTPEAGLMEVERRLESDRLRVTQSLALRAAQIKHVLTNLIRAAEENEDSRTLIALEGLTPPMNPEKLIEYAMDAHASYTAHVEPFLEGAKTKWDSAYVNAVALHAEELENVLLDVRRLVMQNLSKHPGMKPYRLLSEWDALRRDCMNAENEARHAEQIERGWRLRWEEARTDQENLRLAPGFDTFSRLESSRQTLLQRKKEMLEEWMRAWREIEPVLQVFSTKMKTFQTMENAQSRVLQLYLANPTSARGKDTHGAGLMMLLRLAVEALEEKKSPLKKVEREEARALVLRALENPLFVRFSEFARELDVALDANAREYNDHPLFTRRAEGQRREQEAARGGEQAAQVFVEASTRAKELRQKLVRLQKEVEEACRMNLGFTIRWDE